MSFANLSAGGVLVGLVALLGILYLLQRLRVKHRDVLVPTTLFWREAVEEARARVLVRRFRHPLAYLLVAAIGVFLWLAFAAPVADPDEGVDHVVLLDGSAGMARGDRFARAVDRLREQVTRLPRSHTAVRFCGAYSRTLLHAGEHIELLDRRLAGLTPEACAPTIETEVRNLLAVARDRELAIAVIGDASVREDTLALLPANVRLQRIRPAGESGDNRGITAFGVAEAASGAYQSVDVLVEVRGDAAEGAELSMTLDGEPQVFAATSESIEGGRRILLRDVPASGQLLRVDLSGDDGLPLDDSAVLALPERRRFRVALSPGIQSLASRAVLFAALSHDPAVVLDQEPADLVVRRAGEVFGGSVPAFELVPSAEQDDAILLIHGEETESADVLTRALDRLGLAEIDAMELARVAARPIAVGAVVGPVRTVRIWEELLTESFEFARSRAFPMFAARAVRWLGGEADFLPYVAVGEPWPERPGVWQGAWRDAAGSRLDPAGAAFTPPSAGVFRATGAVEVAVALTDPSVTLGTEGTADTPAPEAGVGTFDPITWLGLGALLLLGLEWFLYRTGRMP